MDELVEYSSYFSNLDWLRFITILIGLVCNSLCLAVFAHKSFRNTPLAIYGCALALTDSLALLPGLIIDFFSLRFDLPLTLLSSSLCKSFSFLIDALVPNSAWIILLIAFDTSITIAVPVKNKLTEAVTSNRFRLWAVCLVAAWHILLATPIPAVVDLVEINTLDVNRTLVACDSHHLATAKALAILYYVESILVPFLLMITASVFIARAIYYWRMRLDRSTDYLTSRRVGLTSFALNLMFVVSVSPLIFSYLVPVADMTTANLLNKLSTWFYYSNFSLHFVVFFVANSKFRKRFFSIFGCKLITRDREIDSIGIQENMRS